MSHAQANRDVQVQELKAKAKKFNKATRAVDPDLSAVAEEMMEQGIELERGTQRAILAIDAKVDRLAERMSHVENDVSDIKEYAVSLSALLPKKLSAEEQKAADKTKFWNTALKVGAGVGIVVAGTLVAKGVVAGAEWGYDKLQG